jgi:hypothetical protein
MGACKATGDSSWSPASIQVHAFRIRTRFVKLIQALLDKGTATVVLDLPPKPA